VGKIDFRPLWIVWNCCTKPIGHGITCRSRRGTTTRSKRIWNLCKSSNDSTDQLIAIWNVHILSEAFWTLQLRWTLFINNNNQSWKSSDQPSTSGEPGSLQGHLRCNHAPTVYQLCFRAPSSPEVLPLGWICPVWRRSILGDFGSQPFLATTRPLSWHLHWHIWLFDDAKTLGVQVSALAVDSWTFNTVQGTNSMILWDYILMLVIKMKENQLMFLQTHQ